MPVGLGDVAGAGKKERENGRPGGRAGARGRRGLRLFRPKNPENASDRS